MRSDMPFCLLDVCMFAVPLARCVPADALYPALTTQQTRCLLNVSLPPPWRRVRNGTTRMPQEIVDQQSNRL